MTSRRAYYVSMLAFALQIVDFCAAQTCYFPDGSVASQYAPCGGSSQSCCFNQGPQWDDACFSNGLCHSWEVGYTYRGACTDKGWGTGCPQDCINGECWRHLNSVGLPLSEVSADRKDTIEPVSLCGGASDSSISSPFACCGTPPEAAECCSSGDQGGGFLWYNASIINFELIPKTGPMVSPLLSLYAGSCSATAK